MRPDRQKRRSVESEGTTVATAEAAKERKTVVIAAFVMTNPNSVDLASKNRSVSSDGANLKIPEVEFNYFYHFLDGSLLFGADLINFPLHVFAKCY